MSDGKKGPVLIDLDTAEAPDVTEAPLVPDTLDLGTEGRAMQQIVQVAARKPAVLGRLFWSLLVSVLIAVVSVSAWNFVTGLLAQNPVIGMAFSVLITVFVAVSLIIVLKELVAFSRLRRVDRLRRMADKALAHENLKAARDTAAQLQKLYADRPETAWGRERLQERLPDVFDAAGVFDVVEQDLLSVLDDAAKREVEQAARQVATVTALVPLALADVVSALVSNIRMIRRIADIYAGRSGALGSWRLTRAVMAHLVATGAVAVGDDLLSSIAGGSVLGKISRRFGEGMVNGALTARVGIAAMEVCRPLPFTASTKPSVSRLVKRALAGLFGG